jgi:hypothetical protein
VRLNCAVFWCRGGGYFFENAFRAKSLVSLPFCRSRAISGFVSRSETDEVLGCFCGECGRVEVEL